MKLVGELPVRGRAFAEVMDSLMGGPAFRRRKLLRTASDWGFLSDGYFLSLLSPEEREAVLTAHRRSLDADHEYGATDSLDLIGALPPRVGREAERACYAGRGKKLHLVLLEGGGMQLLVEARAFATAHARHPRAVWRFSRGTKYHRRPVVLLEGGGFFAGKLLGSVTPVGVKDAACFPAHAAGTPSWVLAADGRRLKYVPEGDDSE